MLTFYTLFLSILSSFIVFQQARAFNGDLSKWDVSGVTNMKESTLPRSLSSF